jgi:hypothetical protein
MSRGNDARSNSARGKGGRRDSMGANEPESDASRTSRSSIPMTAERARAIQAQADSSGTNQDFKSRAMSAAHRNNSDKGNG